MMLEAALSYAARGWAVFPCKVRAKEPITEHGFLDATTDPAQIRAWWGWMPNANVAVACGASRLVVVDVDPRHDGDDALAELERRHRELPHTIRALTGGGGTHFLFRAPAEDVRWPKAIVPGVDIKAAGGYILVEPSIHPLGTPYGWDLGAHPDDTPLADLPRWILDLATHSPSKADPLPKRIVAGQRNTTLTSLAGSMRRRGASQEAIFSALEVENGARCDPPLPDSELWAIAKSMMRYEPAAPSQNGQHSDDPAGGAPDQDAPGQDAPERFALTDSGNAELFTYLYRDRIRYDHRHGRWLIFGEHYWQPDTLEEVDQLAKATARFRLAQAAEVEGDKERERAANFALGSESRRAREAMIALARSEPLIADDGEDWDCNPLLVGTENGVVELEEDDRDYL